MKSSASIASLVLATLVPSAVAQEAARYGLPVRVDLVDMASLGGGGQMTPDGRVILRSWAYHWNWGASLNGWPPNQWNGGSHPTLPGWAVQAVRPENITRDASYNPEFSSDVFAPAGNGYLVEPGADLGDYEYVTDPHPPYLEHPNATYGNDFVQNPAHVLPPSRSGPDFPGAVASGIPFKAHTTWFPDPSLDTTPLGETPPTNPYACDGYGAPLSGLPAPEQADYVAYEMISITFADEWTRQASGGGAFHWRLNLNQARIWQVPMKVVVQMPYTADATIHKAWVTGRAQEVRWSTGSGTAPMHLSEISVTQNGHFMVGHGPKPATYVGGHNAFPSHFTFDGAIWATWNSTPGNPQTWHEPVLLSELHQFGNDTLKTVNGVNIPLKDVIRLARQPMRYQNGDPVGERMVLFNGSIWDWDAQWDASLGAYPWVHWDGDGVLYPIGGSRGTIAYCGVQTDFTFASLDAANLSHVYQIAGEEHDRNFEEHVMGGFMAMTGMWDVYRDTARLAGRAVLDAHPEHPREPVFAFIHGEHQPHQKLVTMSFDDWSDGEYMAFLRMTPLVQRIDQLNEYLFLPARLELDRTADTSGNFHVARLMPFADPMNLPVAATHAAFTAGTSNSRPYSASDETLPFYRPIFDLPGYTDGAVRGRIGEALRFGRRGYVEITHHATHTPGTSNSLDSPAISVEAFVKLTPDYLAMARTANTQLFHHADRITVSIKPDNGLQVDVMDAAAGGPVSYESGPLLTQSVWYHVAVTFGNGVLKCYVDGVLVDAVAMTGGDLAQSPINVFEIGPHDTVSGSDSILMYVDEFRLSRIVRSAEEIARHAFVETDRTWETNPANLPPLAGTALEADDCRVDPARPWTAAKAAFGEYMFSNANLSLNQDFSCASCHLPSRSFTENRARTVGHTGITLAFNTQTILDSITGVEKFWDMRARDLADQATQPIVTPAEMGFSSLAPVLARLNTNDDLAVGLNEAAFGTPTITKATLEQGLESFMQAQIAAKTAVELYEGGSTGALTASEKRGRALFRGKARCIACHDGPSYTNSLAQNTGAAMTGQFGRSVHTGRQRDLGAFKTPTLRRVSDQASTSTSPYFHDGFAGTLAQVVDFYDLGGGQAGVSAIAPGRTAIGTPHVEMMRLALTAAEKADLLAFLRRLGE